MDPYFELPRAPIEIGRHEFILAKCKGKRVLHLGCVDSGLLRERFLYGKLLHQKLAKVATELWGIDIDADGISFLRSQGFNNLILGDICNADKVPELRGQVFDVIVASEIVEHLMNPGLFLSAIMNLMIPEHTEIIVTVPNAFRLSTLIQLLHGVEYVHPDHNYWFSYVTAKNLLQKAGFNIRDERIYSFSSPRILPDKIRKFLGNKVIEPPSAQQPRKKSSQSNIWIRLVRYLKTLPVQLVVVFLYKRTPFWGDGLIFVCTKAEGL